MFISQIVYPLLYVFIGEVKLSEFSIKFQCFVKVLLLLMRSCEIITQIFCQCIIFYFILLDSLIEKVNGVGIPPLLKETQAYFGHGDNFPARVLLRFLKERNRLVVLLVLKQPDCIFVLNGKVRGVILKTLSIVQQFELFELFKQFGSL